MVQAELTFESIGLSSQLVRDLIDNKEKALQFVSLPFKIDDIPEQISKKLFSNESRQLLHKSLKLQYDGFDMSKRSGDNLNALLQDNCFTVCTGHQLNLMTGSLYSIYKIAQTVVLASSLNKNHSSHEFVPIFWMATEDHDFEEINHIHLYGRKLSWERENDSMSVGRIGLNGINDFLDEIDGAYQNPELAKIVNGLTDFYRDANNLADANRKLVNHLFGEYGLLILDGDDADLKGEMQQIFQNELSNGTVEKCVSRTNKELESNGYDQQVHVRECNLFYIDENGIRERIIKQPEGFKIGEKNRKLEELLDELASKPERFSPNALMRPLYQECILPNLVYIGGGGEIAYWMQIKALFDELQVTFPMLRVRDSYILLNKKDEALMKEYNLDIVSLKTDSSEIEKEIAIVESSGKLDLKEENELLDQLSIQLKEHAEAIDHSLSAAVEAEMSRMKKSMKTIERKMLNAEKRKHEDNFRKIDRLRQKVYPNRGFQERYENILPTLVNRPKIIEELLDINLDNTPKIKILR